MRIAIVTDNPNEINGYTMVPRMQAAELRKMGHEVLMLCTELPHELLNGESEKNFLKSNVNSFNFVSKIKKFKPEAIFLNGFTSVDILAFRFAKKNNIFVAQTAHTRYAELIKEVLPLGNYLPRNIISGLEKIIIRQLDKVNIIIALTEEMKDYIQEFTKTKIVTISNGVNLDEFTYSQHTLDPKQKINLLYIANIERRKNHKFLLTTMRYLPKNYYLHLIGGRGWDRLYYRNFINILKHENNENIIFHNKLPHHETVRFYKKCQVFVDPALMEAQSLVLIEALCTGLPIVRLINSTNVGVTKDGYTAIHLNSSSTSIEFANSIEKLAKDRDLYNKISRNQKKDRLKFSWHLNAKKMIQLIPIRGNNLGL